MQDSGGRDWWWWWGDVGTHPRGFFLPLHNAHPGGDLGAGSKVQWADEQEGGRRATFCARRACIWEAGDALSRLQARAINGRWVWIRESAGSKKCGFCSEVLLFKKEACHIREGGRTEMTVRTVTVFNGPSKCHSPRWAFCNRGGETDWQLIPVNPCTVREKQCGRTVLFKGVQLNFAVKPKAPLS